MFYRGTCGSQSFNRFPQNKYLQISTRWTLLCSFLFLTHVETAGSLSVVSTCALCISCEPHGAPSLRAFSCLCLVLVSLLFAFSKCSFLVQFLHDSLVATATATAAPAAILLCSRHFFQFLDWLTRKHLHPSLQQLNPAFKT